MISIKNILVTNRKLPIFIGISQILLVVCFLVTSCCYAFSPTVPDSIKTPGAVLSTNKAVICVSGYTKKVRNVPQSLKKEVYRVYGITHPKPREYEVDHLISLELGGSNSIRNLWPESYITSPLNAHIKDRLENKLHQLICSGQITVEKAQHDIAKDWVAAYQKYIGPLNAPSRMPLNVNPSQVYDVKTDIICGTKQYC